MSPIYLFFLSSLVLLVSCLRHHCLTQGHVHLLLSFSFKSFIGLAFIFMPLVHFELTLYVA